MATEPRSNRNRSLLLGIGVLCALALLVWLLRSRIHFNWHVLAHELRSASVGYVAAGVVLNYIAYWLRAIRWAVLVGPLRHTKAREMFPSLLIGFSAVVLFGRLADLVRPYLAARRLGLPVASQLAVYSIERACDLGAAAILFSLTLAVAPRDLPHHTAYVRAGAMSLAATAVIALFVVALRFAGNRVAAIARRMVQLLSANLSERVAERVLDFRNGLQIMTNAREFMVVATLSVVMWSGVAVAYMLSAHAFRNDAVLAHLSFTATMLMLATSLGGSLIQLPILGWFTQMAVVSAALVGFFGVPLETATACSAVVFFVLNLVVVPGGLIAARLDGMSLREAVSRSSEIESTEPQLS